MNDAVRRVIRGCDNRYPNAKDFDRLREYANSMELRIRTVSEMEKAETAVSRIVVKAVKKNYPRFEQCHEEAMDKTARDAALLSRVIAQAVILDDVTHLEEKVLYWFRSICKAFGLTPDFVRDVHTVLRDAYAKVLPEECFALVEPLFERCIEILSDFPAPAIARV